MSRKKLLLTIALLAVFATALAEDNRLFIRLAIYNTSKNETFKAELIGFVNGKVIDLNPRTLHGGFVKYLALGGETQNTNVTISHGNNAICKLNIPLHVLPPDYEEGVTKYEIDTKYPLPVQNSNPKNCEIERLEYNKTHVDAMITIREPTQ